MAPTDLEALFTLAVAAIICIVFATVLAPLAAHTCGGMFGMACQRSSAEDIEADADREEQSSEQHEDSLIRKRLSEVRCRYVREVTNVMFYMTGCFSLVSFFRQPSFNAVQAILMATVFIATLAVRVYPGLLNNKTLWLVHSFYMGFSLCVGTSIGIIEGGSQFLIRQPTLQMINVFIGLTYPEFLPNFLWNTIWAVMAIAASLQIDAEHPWADVGPKLLFSCFGLAFLSLILWKIQELQVWLVRNELDAQGHLQAKATMEKLLSSMCDAVVELNGQLCIRRPCQKLADLLIKRTGPAALTGEEFPELISNDEDRERFGNFVTTRAVPVEQQQNADSDQRASSVHVRLRDATGATVSVQLFHSCHHAPPDDVCHILGVREVLEEPRAVEMAPVQEEPRADEMAAQQAPMMLAQVPAEAAHEDRAHEETESVVSAASTHVSAASAGTQRNMEDRNTLLAPTIPVQAALHEYSVLIDPSNMQTIACTVGFMSFTGPLVSNCPVSDFVENYSDDFEMWVAVQVNARVHNHRRKKKFSITLKPTAKQRPRFEFKGDGYIIHARHQVRPSEMGLEPRANEQVYGHLCVLAVRNIKSRWTLPGTRLNDGPALMESLPRGSSVSL